MKFEVGDKLVYYSSYNYYPKLTIGESYTVLYIYDIGDIICIVYIRKDNKYNYIKTDNGNKVWAESKYFITPSEWREIKINKLLNEI